MSKSLSCGIQHSVPQFSPLENQGVDLLGTHFWAHEAEGGNRTPLVWPDQKETMPEHWGIFTKSPALDNSIAPSIPLAVQQLKYNKS